MRIKTLDIEKSREAMDQWLQNKNSFIVDDEYKSIREDICRLYKLITDKYSDKYDIDMNLGLKLYNYLWNEKNFSLRVATDDGFWRYLSLKVVPDLVAKRWGEDNDSHFWSKSRRIWLKSIWWYIHLSWQGDIESTKKVLTSQWFTTDSILNLVERPGREGTFIDVYRRIMYYYSQVKSSDIKSNRDLFRVVMKLNTAKCIVIEPALCSGGIDGYVKNLFADAGVDFNAS